MDLPNNEDEDDFGGYEDEGEDDFDWDEDVGSSMDSAIRNGKADTVSELIDSYGLSYLEEWQDGYNLLCDALQEKQSQVAEILITTDCRVNSGVEWCSKPTPLHLAVRNKDLNIMDLLLQKGASINSTSTYGWYRHTLLEGTCIFPWVQLTQSGMAEAGCGTALHLAFHQCDEIAAKYLLEHGADVDAIDSNGVTVLYQAVKKHFSPDQVKLILSGHPSVHCESNRAAVVLAQDENDELMKVLLEYGFNILLDDEGHTLYNAIRNGDVDRVREWLENGYDARKSCKDTCTALHVAARYRQTEIARLLKDRGFDEKSKNEIGKTPLDYAFINADWTMSEILIGPTNVNIDSEFIIAAVMQGYSKFVENLLKLGADVNARVNIDSRRVSLLHIAVWRGVIDTVKILLDFHADVNSTEVIDGLSALHFAVRDKNFEICRILLDKGARSNAPSEKQLLTPLHFACQENDKDVVNLLLENCADVDSLSKYGSPLHISSGYGYTDIVKLLLNHGADVNCISLLGFTPLHDARQGLSLTPNHTYPAMHIYRSCPTQFCAREETFDVLFRRLVMTQAAGLYVCQQNMKLLEPETFRFFVHGNGSPRPTQMKSDFPAECSKEIDMLKREKIGDLNLSLYHILAANERQLVNLSRNESLVQAFSCNDFKEKFPIYGSMMEWKFKLGVKKRILGDKGEESVRLFFPACPLVCIHLIIDYLTYEDLRIFVNACLARPDVRRE